MVVDGCNYNYFFFNFIILPSISVLLNRMMPCHGDTSEVTIKFLVFPLNVPYDFSSFGSECIWMITYYC